MDAPVREGSAPARIGVRRRRARRDPAPGFDRARFRRLFFAVMVPMFLAAVDQTLLATATPVISRELGGLRDTSWLAVAYLLASVIMVPLYGRLGDRFGRRKVLSVAIVVFAPRLARLRRWRRRSALLVAARVVQGLGGGGLMTLSQALIGEVVAPRLRARNQSYFAIIFTLASVGGPVIGGLVVHHASWRWLFLVNLPLCALAVWRLRTMLGDDRLHPARGKPDAPASSCSRSPRRPPSSGSRRPAIASRGRRRRASCWWRRRSSSAIALVRVERRAERPFLPIELLAMPAVRYAVLTVIGFASAMFAMVFYLPVYLQLALHSNPAESGLLLLPLTGGIVFGAALTGRIIVWTGRPTAIPSVGLCVAALVAARPGGAAADAADPDRPGDHDRPRPRLGDVGDADRHADGGRPGAARRRGVDGLAGAHARLVARRVGVRRADLRPDRRRAGDRRRPQRRRRRAHRRAPSSSPSSPRRRSALPPPGRRAGCRRCASTREQPVTAPAVD